MTPQSKFFKNFRRRADLAAIACIGLFFVAFFPQGLFGGKYLLVNDAFFYNYPLRTIAWRMLGAGELPLWTPYLMSGYPLLSMAQIGIAYPLTWGYAFLPGHVAEQIYVLAPFLLAPLFTYAYLREIGRSPLASLLGALTFGYGGMMASPLANNGLMPNAVMWLPLMLIAVERAHRNFIRALLFGTFAYAMSVLTGYGQGFVYIGLIAAAYACLLVVAPGGFGPDNWRAKLRTLNAWRPVLVIAGAGLLAVGLSAFQIMEAARAVPRSVRSSLNYQLLTQGSMNPLLLVNSFITPLFHVIDMTAYVPPLAVLLGAIAVYGHIRWSNGKRDLRVYFWLTLAVLAGILMMGSWTPFYRIVYHLPLLNRFRVPSRHTFEWTFAVGVLAAYGWDTLAQIVRQRREAIQDKASLIFYVALLLFVFSAVAGGLWWWKQPQVPGALSAENTYRLWKLLFVLLTAGAIWFAGHILDKRWRTVLLWAAVLVLCFVEPSLLISRWWGGTGMPASRFTQQTEVTTFLQQFPAAENRIYTRVALMSEQFGNPPRFDSANLSAVHGLHNLSGYEPLILERYSRALGGVWLDAVHTVDYGVPDRSLFGARSHVLDLLNTRYVVSYSNLAPSVGSPGEPGISDKMEVIGELHPQETKTLVVRATEADGLRLVTSLSNSTFVPDGETVARVRCFTTDGKIVERELKAGRDTAEWAHERPDVRSLIKHKLATPFDATQIGGEQGYLAYRFQSLLTFGERLRVNRVEITNVSANARLGIYGALLEDSQSKSTFPLSPPFSDAWHPVYEQNGVLVLHNKRALPRAWLVSEAESVNGEEARYRIRGETERSFDPRRTVLLEMHPNELPSLPGGPLAAESEARVVAYEPNRLVVETKSPTATVLVLSEMFYPGWEATVDGQRAKIHLANYLFRAVALPAGQHRVELRYTASAARNGAVISALTLCLIAGLAIYAARRKASGI